MKNGILTVLLVFFTIILTITFSIGLPIYVRPFYYLQIDFLNLPEKTGVEKADIIASYDEVLDYLTKPNKEFGTGVFRYSESGKSHFEDCKKLFNLNAVSFCVSQVAVLVLMFLKFKKVFKPLYPFKLYHTFTSGVLTLLLFLGAGVYLMIDFENAFVIFHSLLFPGKGNWVFDSNLDPIIDILPIEFFMSCAGLIILSVIVISFTLIIYGIIKNKAKQANKN